MTEPLKDCPFCGSKAEDAGALVTSIKITVVRCSNMDCLASFKTVDAAAWNRRAPAPASEPAVDRRAVAIMQRFPR